MSTSLDSEARQRLLHDLELREQLSVKRLCQTYHVSPATIGRLKDKMRHDRAKIAHPTAPPEGTVDRMVTHADVQIETSLPAVYVQEIDRLAQMMRLSRSEFAAMLVGRGLVYYWELECELRERAPLTEQGDTATLGED